MSEKNENTLLFRRFVMVALAVAACGFWAANAISQRNASGWETRVHRTLPFGEGAKPTVEKQNCPPKLCVFTAADVSVYS